MIETKQARARAVVFDVLLVSYVCLTFLLFLQQALGMTGSDMPMYVDEVLGTNTAYVFSYPLFFDVAKLINLGVRNGALATATAAALLNGLAPVCIYGCLRGELLRQEQTALRRERGL